MACSRKSSRRRSPVQAYFSGQGNNLITSLLLVFPLFLFYQVGVLFTPLQNGADFLTTWLLRLASRSQSTYLLVSAACALAFVLVIAHLRRRQRFDPRWFAPLLLESAVYALSMGSLIVLVLSDLLDVRHLAIPAAGQIALGQAADVGQLSAAGQTVDPGQASLAQAGVFDKLVLSAGAGVHEELVFRLLLLSLLALALTRLLGWQRWPSLVLAFVLSSLLFSAAHGEFAPYLFLFRFLSGLVFAVIFTWRGFAVAVYTHALYDVYVLLL